MGCPFTAGTGWLLLLLWSLLGRAPVFNEPLHEAGAGTAD